MTNNPDDTLTVFGNSLRELRKGLGLSQEELAHRCGLDRTYISGLERGKRNPTLKVLSVVAQHLNVSLSDLLLSIKKQGSPNDKDQQERG